MPYNNPSEDTEYDYENLSDDGEDEYRVMSTPRFLSTPQTLLINEGDTIRLPCKVDRLEGFVMLWKKNKNIITVGDQIIDKSVRLENESNGNSIVMGPATPEHEAVRLTDKFLNTPDFRPFKFLETKFKFDKKMLET